MVGYLARIELSRRWRSLVLLAALVAVVVGTVLAAVAGARRSDSAFDRYLEAMRPPDVGVFGEDEEALAKVAELPHVETAAPVELVAIVPPERPGEEFYPMLVSLDGKLPYEHLRPKVVSGRLPAPDEPLAVALGERTARRLGKQVGDRLPMEGYTPEGLAAFDDEGDLPDPDGPSFDLEVVGIVRGVGDLVGRETDLDFTLLPPAFRERFPGEQIGVLGRGTFVVLDDPASLDAFARAAAPLGLEVDTRIVPAAARSQADPTVSAISTALYVFAAVAALAGAVAVAQAIGRGLQPALADVPTLEALGVPRAGRWAGLVLPQLAALAVGALGGVVVAVAASPLMPVGLARRAEPQPGLDVDGAALGLGFAASLLLLCLIALAVTASSARSVRAGTAAQRPSRVARWAADGGASPARTVGLGFAAVGGSPTAGASRAALGGVAVGVLGAVAAVTFAASIDRLVASPHLYGWGWDATLGGADLSHLTDGALDDAALLADPDVAAVAEVVFQLQASLDGSPTYATVMSDQKGHVAAVMVRGRQPDGPGEVALAGASADDVGKGVGDTVTVDLGDGPRALEVTGVVSLPVSEDGGASSTGLLMTDEAASALGFPGDCSEDASCYRNVAVELRDGADHEAVLGRYATDESGVTADLPTPPGEVQRLTAVEDLPWFLAGFLALLAASAITHSAATAVRRRRRDLALLRVLGFTGRQVRSVVTTQVTAISVVGALVGVAAGVVVGRLVWRGIVDSIPLPFSPAMPLIAITLVLVAAVAVAQLAAVLPRRTATQLRPADVLRAE